jgi:hypothetical protein
MEGVGWINMNQGMNKWQDTDNMVMNLSLP